MCGAVIASHVEPMVAPTMEPEEMGRTKGVKTSLRLPASLHEQLMRLSAGNDRSLNSEIVSCLEAMLLRKEIEAAVGNACQRNPTA